MVGEQLAERIREELGRRRVTRQWLADEARISLSTLEKGLAGQRRFTLATIVRIEGVLGLSLRPARGTRDGAAAEVAPDELGAYARPAVRWLEGDYLTVRPAFGTPGALVAYRTILAWDEAAGHLVFRESDRADAAYTQRGDVAFPHQSGHLYLVTREAGQFRMAILGRPSIAGAMHGLLTTLHAGGGARLMPVSCPIALMPLASMAAPRFGLIAPGDADHAGLAAMLAQVETDGFARLVHLD